MPESKVPVYIAILIAVILVAAAGYFVLGSENGKIHTTQNKDANNMKDESYYFVIRGSNSLNDENGITIEVNDISEETVTRINSLENGLQKLRSKCNVISYETLGGIQGGTVAYSVTVKGICNPNK